MKKKKIMLWWSHNHGIMCRAEKIKRMKYSILIISYLQQKRSPKKKLGQTLHKCKWYGSVVPVGISIINLE
jgi:hypothetical protein